MKGGVGISSPDTEINYGFIKEEVICIALATQHACPLMPIQNQPQIADGIKPQLPTQEQLNHQEPNDLTDDMFDEINEHFAEEQG